MVNVQGDLIQQLLNDVKALKAFCFRQLFIDTAQAQKLWDDVQQAQKEYRLVSHGNKGHAFATPDA